jgi:hypothetical protein
VDSPAGVAVKDLASPDATWTFLDESERAAVRFDRVAIGRGVYRPGWRWSEHVQPLSGKEADEHIGYVISGRMGVRTKQGTEIEVGPAVLSSSRRVTMPGWCATSPASHWTSFLPRPRQEAILVRAL